MARRIQDIDLGAFMHDGRVLGKDRNAAFTFLIIGVHDTFLHLFIGTENMALFQHGIDQSRLTMVNVSDDGNVTQIISNHKSLIPSTLDSDR